MTKQRRINDIKGMNADWKNLIKSWNETIEELQRRNLEMDRNKRVLRDMMFATKDGSEQEEALAQAIASIDCNINEYEEKIDYAKGQINRAKERIEENMVEMEKIQEGKICFRCNGENNNGLCFVCGEILGKEVKA